jgi:hypothetical protein
MRGLSWMVVPTLLAVVSAVTAQEGVTTRPRRDAHLEALVADAMAAPPEFAADVLIRVAQSSLTSDQAWRRELLEEAFIRAYGAQAQYRRVSAPISPDTREGAEALAADTSLNRVALQVRVVQAMRSFDAKRARDLFGWIELNLDEDACESPLTPALDEYYLALATLARRAFPDTLQGRSDGLAFFDLFLWRARVPSEMPSILRAILRFHANAAETAYLENVVWAILTNSERGPRAFSVAATDIASKISELRHADQAVGVGGPQLLAALRQYLIAQLTGPRCVDSTADAVVVEIFNALVQKESAERDGIAPISTREAEPSKRLGVVRLRPYWTTPDARRLHDDAVRLRGTGAQPVPIAVRRSSAWIEQAERHLVDVQQWPGTRETSEHDHFYQKAALFAGLIDLVPPGAVRVRTLRVFAEFLHHNDAERRRPLWFLFANRLIERIQSEDRRDVLQAIDDTGDQVLSLYADAARITRAGVRN